MSTLLVVVDEVHHFFLLFELVDWNTDEADIKFSMYWPSTWFSERNLRFSSFTLSTRCDKSIRNMKNNVLWVARCTEGRQFVGKWPYHRVCSAIRAPAISDVPSLLVHLDWCLAPSCALSNYHLYTNWATSPSNVRYSFALAHLQLSLENNRNQIFISWYFLVLVHAFE